ncbi:MAG: hypothetical protein JXA20_05170 [Spirochaetes bacterium]|nr:hypothetical protein [Spirochaetota bacterium]
MAIVSYNRSIRSFHGAVGRMVFYEREGQTLLRCKGERTLPRSPAQKALQGAFREASALWMELSAEEKEPWRHIGKAQGITGYNAFLRVNIPRLKQGLPAAVDAPAQDLPVQVNETRPPVEAHHPVARGAPHDEGCRRFMEEMRLMVLRVSRDVDRHCILASSPGASRPRVFHTYRGSCA